MTLNPLRQLQRRFPSFRPWLLWLDFVLRGRRINRDQWDDATATATKQVYQNLTRWSWDETQVQTPQYFRVLQQAVGLARGRVLELGCGVGNMTRWFAAKGGADSILAIDAFPFAVGYVRQAGYPNVDVMCAPVEALGLPPGRKFDTVVLCELIEHLYTDEEQKMLDALRPSLERHATFVVSTPVGFMPDPNHVRGFSKNSFKRHIRRHYGTLEGVDYSSGYSQVAWGKWHDS